MASEPLTPEEYSRMKALEPQVTGAGGYDLVEPTPAMSHDYRQLRDRFLRHGVRRPTPQGEEQDDG